MDTMDGPESYLSRDEVLEHVTADGMIAALAVIEDYGMIDGAHHKQWVLDQAVRDLLGPTWYAIWRARFDAETARLDCTSWEEGIAP